jgi:hypothetical protein
MTNEIQEQLEALAEIEGSNVYTNLKQDDIAALNFAGKTVGYQINTPNYFRRTISSGQSIVNAAVDSYLAFRNEPQERSRIISQYRNEEDAPLIVPYLEFFNKGVGLCAEKSILFQLMVQDSLPSYLVFGRTHMGNGFHAYNVIVHQDNPTLVDVQNPVLRNQQQIVPFIGAITTLNQQEFVLNENSRKLGLAGGYFLA